MADYNLGTARGRLEVDASDVEKGAAVGTKAVKGYEGAAKKAGRTGAESMGKVGTVTAGAGLAIVAALGLAVKSAASFEERLSAIEAVSGGTESQMEAVRAKALQLGADTKFSASEAAQAIEELSKAGISLPDILNGAADAAVALAAAGEIDLPQAATIASNAMNVFALSAKEMPKVADLIAGAANASAIDVSQFGQSLQQAGAAAHLAGVTFPDLTTAIALLGNAGIKGSDAGTSLKTMLLNLNPATKKQSELMKKLGIITQDGANAFFDAHGKAKSLSDISGVLQKSLAGMTQQQKLAALEVLFGSDAIRAAAVLADEGATGFDKMAASIGKVKAADVAAKRMDNLKGNIEQMKGSLETAAIVVGSVFIPILTTVVKSITGLINAFGQLSPGVQSAIAVIVSAVGAFLLLFGTVLKVGSMIAKAGAAISLAFASPLGIVLLVVAAIIGLAAAVFILYQRFQGVRNVVDTVGRALQTGFLAVLPVFQAIVAGVKQFVLGLAGAQTGASGFLGFMNKLGTVIRTVVIPAIVAIGEFLLKTFGPIFTQVVSIVGGFVTAIIGYFRSIQPQITTILNAILVVFKAVFGFLLPIVVPIFKFILSFIIQTLQLLAVGIRVLLAGIANIFRGVFNIIGGIIKVFLSLITGQWGAAWEGVKQIVRGALQFILGIIQAIVGAAIVGICVSSLKLIGSVFRAGWALVRGVTTGAFGAIRGAVVGGMNAIRSIVVAIFNIIKSAFQLGWAIARGSTSGAVAAIKGIVAGLRSIVSTIHGIWSSVTGAFRTGVSNAVSVVKGLPGRVVGAIGNLGSLLIGKGREIVQGLISGIEAMFGKLAAVASKIGGIIGKVIPGSPVEEGPLRVLNRGYAGKKIVEMLADGITDNIGMLNATARDLSTMLGSASVAPTANKMIDTLPRTSLAAQGGDGAEAPDLAALADLVGRAVTKGLTDARFEFGQDGVARIVAGSLVPVLAMGGRA